MVQALHTLVKGRARYKVNRLYRSESLRRHLESGLAGKEGISRFSINTATGNILVYFNSHNTPQTVASLIKTLVLEYGRNGGSLPANGLVRPEGKETRTGELRSESRRKIRKLVTHAEPQEAEAWHAKDKAGIVGQLQTSESTGLSSEAAALNLKKYGPNLLPESVPRSGFSILLDQVNSLPNALLGVAAGLSLFTGGLADALVIASVVAINTIIGYVTESQAEKTIHSLKGLVRPSALVIRDGLYKEVPAEEVVVGDILVLRPGSYVAADSRLLEANHLSVDESALTGESLPVIKTPGPIADRNVPLADRVNMVYMGTLVTGGQGLAAVIATGKYTEIGKIQTLVGEAEPPATPMEKQLSRMGAQLVVISGAVCGLVFIVGMLRGYGLLRMLKVSISLAVAAVPEGLPTIATTTLALGIRSMKKHNVLIRHLDAVETLGSVQTICLDKTGTLTRNRMSVVAVHTGMRRISVSGERFLSGEGTVNP
ncbi:MAG TPA: HAD-IC family P-type ATPase, partial [Dissulfurispiraceae bacterium]